MICALAITGLFKEIINYNITHLQSYRVICLCFDVIRHSDGIYSFGLGRGKDTLD